MRQTVFALVPFCLVFCGDVRAQTYIGSGGTPCGMFTKSLADKNFPVVLALTQWVEGYVSGLSLYWGVSRGGDLLARLPDNSAAKFLLGYCAANPEKTLTNAANEWWSTLLPRR